MDIIEIKEENKKLKRELNQVTKELNRTLLELDHYKHILLCMSSIINNQIDNTFIIKND